MHAGATLTASIEEGVQYANGAFSLVNNPNYSVTWDSPTITGKSGSVSLTYYPANVVFSLQPFSVGGPTIEFDPFVRATGTYGTEGASVEATYGIESEVGGEVGILGHNLGSFAYPIGAWESSPYTIWKSSSAEDGGKDGATDGSTTSGSEGGADGATADGQATDGQTTTGSEGGADGATADGGTSDSGTADGGTSDSGTADGGETDSGSSGTDSGSGETDSGSSGTDSGSGETDSGSGTTDSGSGSTDSGGV